MEVQGPLPAQHTLVTPPAPPMDALGGSGQLLMVSGVAEKGSWNRSLSSKWPFQPLGTLGLEDPKGNSTPCWLVMAIPPSTYPRPFPILLALKL